MAEEKKSSWLSSWGGGLLGSALGGLFGIGQQLIGNSYNRKEAQKNRDFQSQEAELNRIFQSNEAAMQRDWSSQEAERARDWQEEMNAKYNSIAGKIAQAEEAGVNPMYAITGNAVSPASASTSAPSGASAGSVGSPSGSTASASFVDIVGSILGMAKLKSEIENVQADTEQKRAGARNLDVDSEYTSWLSRLSEREYKVITENNFDVQEIQSRLNLTNDQALQAFQLAGKYFEEAGKIAEEREFLSKTSDDREKIVEYEKLISEFESSMSSALDSLDSEEKLSLKQWVSIIFKSLLALK